jgi:hypothetical protein
MASPLARVPVVASIGKVVVRIAEPVITVGSLLRDDLRQ